MIENPSRDLNDRMTLRKVRTDELGMLQAAGGQEIIEDRCIGGLDFVVVFGRDLPQQPLNLRQSGDSGLQVSSTPISKGPNHSSHWQEGHEGPTSPDFWFQNATATPGLSLPVLPQTTVHACQTQS